MKIKVTVPENIDDITLGQYQKFIELSKRTDLTDLEYNKRIIKIFTGLKYNQVDKIPYKEYEGLVNDIINALGQETPFKNTFKLGDTEFGFIPNLDEITTKEFVDLSNYILDVENYHKIMAILFRPIKQKDVFMFFFKKKGNYSIIEYNGTKGFADIMKRMPLSIANGAIVFFYNLAKELKIHTQKYTKVEQVKEVKRQDTLISGDGTQQLTT